MTDKRTAAQIEALERDEWKCQWHLVMLNQLRDATDAHHLFRPRYDYDRPEFIISLCAECHRNFRHTQHKIHDKELIENIMIPYIWGGINRSPKGLQQQRGHYDRDGIWHPKRGFKYDLDHNPDSN